MSATWLRMRRSATTGSFFGSNLTKKMPQGWFGESGRRRLISWILAAFFGVDPELVGREVRRVVHVLESVAVDRPAHLVAQVGDELVEALDAPRARRGGRSASAQPSFSSIQHLSAGLTPTGASTRFR